MTTAVAAGAPPASSTTPSATSTSWWTRRCSRRCRSSSRRSNGQAYRLIEQQRPAFERLAGSDDGDLREYAEWAVEVVDRRAEIEIGLA
jgi:hypothetical protein